MSVRTTTTEKRGLAMQRIAPPHFFSRMALAEKLREFLKGFISACFICTIFVLPGFLAVD